jgi:DNA-binding MarR family transcriptional regulator
MSTATQPHVGVLFFVAHRAVEQRVLQAAQAAGHPVTQAQGRVAARIGPDGTRLTELAAAAQVTKQTAGFLVDQLEKAGYVERVPDPTDARARLVRLAARGLEVVVLARAVEAQVRAEWEQHLGHDDYAQLEDLMARLREITDPYAPGSPGA